MSINIFPRNIYFSKLHNDIPITIHFVKNNLNQALSAFNINQFTEKDFYIPFVDLYLCETDYLLHINVDNSLLNPNGITWIDEAITLLSSDNRVLTCSPSWITPHNTFDFDSDGPMSELVENNSNFILSSGFSDNFFLAKVETLSQIDFNVDVDSTSNFPDYGGISFEKRIASYMQVNNLFRGLHKNVFYIPGYVPKRRSINKFTRVFLQK